MFNNYYLRVTCTYIPQLAREFSGRSKARFFALVVQLWWFVFSRKVFRLRKKVELDCEYKDQKFVLALEAPMDIAVLAEVFVLKEYEWELPFAVNSVLDLGAHWGDSAIYFSLNYPKAKVCAVEPSIESFTRLEHFTKQFKNVLVLQGALGSHDGELHIYASKNSLGNSIVERSGDEQVQVVPCYSLSTLASKFTVTRFDLVKFDIEGAEKFIFENKNLHTLSKAYIGEIHLDLLNTSLSEIEKSFAGFSVEFKKISDTRYIVQAIAKKVL